MVPKCHFFVVELIILKTQVLDSYKISNMLTVHWLSFCSGMNLKPIVFYSR
jgi:hypothetical protein